jgi:hypothetical protein
LLPALAAIGRTGAIFWRRPFWAAGLIGPDVGCRLIAGFHRQQVHRTCFCGVPKSSMFAQMPLDNRTVVQFAAQTAIAGFSGRLKRGLGRDDLKFRRGLQFCNIEPKICQHD